MIKNIKFIKLFHKTLQSLNIQSPYKVKLGIYKPKKKIYSYKFKELIQILKLGNYLTKKLIYNIYYFLNKIYTLYYKF